MGARLRRGLLAVGAVALLAACEKPVSTYTGAGDDQPKRTHVMTPDGADTYAFGGTGPTALITAPSSNQGGNLRTVFWPTGVAAATDTQTCATWTSQAGANVQQGAALRLKSYAGGRFRAVTVTKNILWGAAWNFNVHVWDTASSTPYRKVGAIELEDYLRPNGVLRPFPWHVCARVLGATVELKVWVTDSEPQWGDGVHGGSVALPSGWTYAGTTGWYVGHLPPGGSARFDHLRTWKYVDDGKAAAADRAGRTSGQGRTITDPSPADLTPP